MVISGMNKKYIFVNHLNLLHCADYKKKTEKKSTSLQKFVNHNVEI